MSAAATIAKPNFNVGGYSNETKNTPEAIQHREMVESSTTKEKEENANIEDNEESERKVTTEKNSNENEPLRNASETLSIDSANEHATKTDNKNNLNGSETGKIHKKASVSFLDSSKLLEEQDKAKPENSLVGSVQHIEDGNNDKVNNDAKTESKNVTNQLSLMPVKPTLLQLAALYQQQHPDKVAKREREQTKLLNESYGIFESDPFIESYYIEMEKARKEELLEIEREKHMPPQLKVTLEFNPPDEVRKGFIKTHRTYKKVGGDGLFIFHRDESTIEKIEEAGGGFREETRGDEHELLIRVSSGKYLNNRLLEKEQEPIYNSTLECELFAKEIVGHSTMKHKTKPVYVTSHGTAFWEFVFVAKGYTKEHLRKSYVILTVDGKFHHDHNDDPSSPKSIKHRHKSSHHLKYLGSHSVEIGQTLLGNYRPKDSGWKRSHSCKAASNTESKAWEKALKNPGEPIPVELILHEKKEEFSTISELVRPNTDRHQIHRPEDPVEIQDPDENKSIFHLSFHGHHHKKQEEKIPSISELVRPSVNIQRSDSIGDADDLQDEKNEKPKIHFGLHLHKKKKKYDGRKQSTSSRGSAATLRSDADSINEGSGNLSDKEETKSKLSFSFHHHKKKKSDQRKLSTSSKSSIDSILSESGNINEAAKKESAKKDSPSKKSLLSFGGHHRHKKDKEGSTSSLGLKKGSVSSQADDDAFVLASDSTPKEEKEESKQKSKSHFGFHHKKKKDDSPKLSELVRPSIDFSAAKESESTNQPEKTPSEEDHKRHSSKHHFSFHHHHHHHHSQKSED